MRFEDMDVWKAAVKLSVSVYQELKGVAPTGQKCKWGEAWWSRTVDGKPLEGSFVVDGVARLQQLGVLPAPDSD